MDASERLFIRRFHLRYLYLGECREALQEGACLSAASKRSEQLPEGTLERTRSSRLTFVFYCVLEAGASAPPDPEYLKDGMRRGARTPL